MLWQLPHPPALQTTVQHADVTLRHRPTGRLSSTIRFLIYLEFHQHSRLYTTLYTSAIQNTHLSQSLYPVKLLSCSRKLYIS